MRDFSKSVKWLLKQERLARRRKRKKIPAKLRALVFSEKGRSCTYCGALDVSDLDHVRPVILGGENTFENLVPCCVSCNSRKGIKYEVAA